MGMVVIVPDGFAYDASTPMGQLRNKKLQGLKRATDDVDYWADDLLYSSAAVGSYNYSTKAESAPWLKEAKRRRGGPDLDGNGWIWG